VECRFRVAKRSSGAGRVTKEYEKIGVYAPVWQDTRTLVETVAKGAPRGSVTLTNTLPAGTEIPADPLVSKVFYT